MGGEDYIGKEVRGGGGGGGAMEAVQRTMQLIINLEMLELRSAGRVH